jgi:hypothetical protein
MKVVLRMLSSHVVIRDLDAMEDLVKSNPRLKWDGWDVLHIQNKKASFMNRNSMLVDGKWVLVNRYSPESNGWTVPRNVVSGRS